MRKILLIGMALIALAGCNDKESGFKTIQSETAARAAESSANSSFNLENNVIEALASSCAQAEEINKMKTKDSLVFGSNQESSTYSCVGDANPILNVGVRNQKTYDMILWFVLGMAGFILIIVKFDKLAALATGNAIRVQNFAISSLFRGMNLVILLSYSILSLFILSLSLQWGTTTFRIQAENQQFKEASVDIPDFSSKNEKIEAITEYLICVKSRSFDSTQDASLKMFKTTQGYTYKGSYDRCSLNISFGNDVKGQEISKHYGFFNDFNARQSEAVNAALQTLITDAEKIAVSLSRGLNRSFASSGFNPDNFTCQIDQLAAVDTSYFDKKELASYKRFADNCLARNFVFNLTKAPGVTMEGIDNQEIALNHRRVHICDGTYSQKALVGREDIKQQYKACIQRNCADMIGAGSVYACSVAINKYFLIDDNRYQQFFMLPAADPRRKLISKDSEQKLVNTFNAVFTFLEQRDYYNTQTALSTIPVSTAKGSLSLSEIEDTFKAGDASVIDSITNIDFGGIWNRLFPAGGIAGTKRWETCIQHPYEFIDGFDCGSNDEEIALLGMHATVLGIQLKFGSMLHSMPDKRRPLSAKSQLDDAQMTIAMKLIDKISGPVSNKMKAYFLPTFGADGLALAADNIFGSSSFQLTGNYAVYYSMMLLLDTLPEAGQWMISALANLLFIIGQSFIYLLPTLPAFAFVSFMAFTIYNLLFKKITLALRWVVNIDSPPDRRDLDRVETIIYLEQLAFIGVNAASAFILMPNILSTTMSTLIGPLHDFSVGLFGSNAAFGVGLLAAFISILVFILIFKISVSIITNISKTFESMYLGKQTSHELRIQGQDEAKAIAKAYKGKYLS